MQLTEKGERYTYLPLVNTLNYFFACGNVAIGLAFIVVGVYFYSTKGWNFSWPPMLVGVLWTWFMLYALKLLYASYRPIVIDEGEISALAFRHVWKSIPWVNVKRIERIRRIKIKEFRNTYGYTLAIIGSDETINIEDTIRKLPQLLNTLNAYAQRYQIPIVARDLGEDTKANIRATVKDKREQNRLLKEGIQTSIAAL